MKSIMEDAVELSDFPAAPAILIGELGVLIPPATLITASKPGARIREDMEGRSFEVFVEVGVEGDGVDEEFLSEPAMESTQISTKLCKIIQQRTSCKLIPSL